LDTAIDPIMNKEFVGMLLHKFTNPLLLGFHYAGTIVQIGDQVKGFDIGDDVFGHLQYSNQTTQGSLAEYITVKANSCAHKPKSINPSIAAASTTETLTALQGLRDIGGLQHQEDIQNGNSSHQPSSSSSSSSLSTVLINGAGGGVGSAAVQIAKRMGAHVTAICSTKDVEKVKDLGAHIVIDRKRNPSVLSDCSPGQFDIIFDTANALPPNKTMRYLKPSGVVVLTAPKVGHVWGLIRSFFTKKKMIMMMVESKKADLEVVGTWLQDDFKIYIDSTYPIKDIEKALVRNRQRKNGRVVIQVDNGW